MRSRIGVARGPSYSGSVGLLCLSWLPIGPCFRPGFLLVKGARLEGRLAPFTIGEPEVDHAATHLYGASADCRSPPDLGGPNAGARVRLARADVERMMEGRPPGSTLEEALEVFEVFASGTLADEVYVLDDVGGKRIAIAPAALKAKYRKE